MDSEVHTQLQQAAFPRSALPETCPSDTDQPAGQSPGGPLVTSQALPPATPLSPSWAALGTAVCHKQNLPCSQDGKSLKLDRGHSQDPAVPRERTEEALITEGKLLLGSSSSSDHRKRPRSLPPQTWLPDVSAPHPGPSTLRGGRAGLSRQPELMPAPHSPAVWPRTDSLRTNHLPTPASCWQAGSALRLQAVVHPGLSTQHRASPHLLQQAEKARPR